MKRTLAFILILATNTFSQSVILNSIVSDFQVSKASSDIYNDYPPKIQVLPDETFLISWIEEGSEGININAQIFSNDGSAKGEIFQVNDNSYLKPSKSFRVNSFADGKFAFAWESYIQRYSSDKNRMGDNFFIDNKSEGCQISTNPHIWMFVNGDFLLAWNHVTDNDVICAQLFSADGEALTEIFNITDNGKEIILISADDDTNVLIKWMNSRNKGEKKQILGQRVSQCGECVGKNCTLNNIPNGLTIYDQVGAKFKISHADNGSYIILWGHLSDVYVKCFSKDGSSLSEAIKIPFNISWDEDLYVPDISIDSKGNFIIVYNSSLSSISALYGNIYEGLSENEYTITDMKNGDKENWNLYPSVELKNNRIYTTRNNQV